MPLAEPSLYAEVILPLAVRTTYHYRLGQGLFGAEVAPDSLIGRRVTVSFGKRRLYTGLICSVDASPPEGFTAETLKAVEELLDDAPLVDAETLTLWRWVAEYYHCSLGQVMRVALPGGLLPESETLVRLVEGYTAQSGDLSARELDLLTTLTEAGAGGLSLGALSARVGGVAQRDLNHLVTLGAITLGEELGVRYKPRLAQHVRLCPKYHAPQALSELWGTLAKAPRQEALLLRLLGIYEQRGIAFGTFILRTELLREQPEAQQALSALVRKGILELERCPISRLVSPAQEISSASLQALSAPSLTAPVTLLHSDAETDKLQTMLALVGEALARGEQVLWLTPYSVPTPRDRQVLAQLEHLSGGAVFTYTATTPDAKRVELYRELSERALPCVVWGSRPAVFLPLSRLGLILVDEEQDFAHKEQYIQPAYHARDIALYLGQLKKIPVVLASLTPSLEATFNALRGKYALLRLERSIAIDAPIMLDVPRRQAQGSLSPELIEMMHETLGRGGRILLLHSRRGYAPAVVCRGCGERLWCPRCAVALTYYERTRHLRCHYCAYEQGLPRLCPKCASSQGDSLELQGYGSERIEQELGEQFPDASLLRLDAETLQTAQARAEVEARLASGDVDIILASPLVRHQAIWQGVELIAVIELDALLAQPDFRSLERAYQLLYGCALHAREQGKAKLVLQVVRYNQSRAVVDQFLKLLEQPQGFADLLKAREIAHFPPFYRLSYIKLSASTIQLVEQVAQQYAQILMGLADPSLEISPVQTPSLARVNLKYIRLIVCRRPYSRSYRYERVLWLEAEARLKQQNPLARRVQIAYNVDPL